MSKPRELSKVFTTSTELATDTEMVAMVTSASAHAMSAAMAYTDSEISSFEALPSQSGNNGKYLTTNGSTTSWASVDALPSQTGNNGKYLTTNGASASWATLDLNSAITTASAAAVTYLVDGAPAALDTLNELAAALNDDASFATSVTNSLATKLNASTASATYLTQSSASSTYATKAEAQNSIDRWTKIYSASATTISGVDDSANSLSYTPNFENLYINGILVDPTNYTASSGSTIVLNEAVVVDDVVEVISIMPFNVANTYTTSQIDEKLSNYTRWVKTLSGSATVISGVDDNSLPLTYTAGNEEVYINGILLKKTADYATTSASVITLVEPALSGDTVEIINFTTINLATVYTQQQSDSRYEPNITYTTSQPASPSAGTLWIDSTNTAAPALKVYNGSTWIAVSGASEAGLHPFFQAGI